MVKLDQAILALAPKPWVPAPCTSMAAMVTHMVMPTAPAPVPALALALGLVLWAECLRTTHMVDLSHPCRWAPVLHPLPTLVLPGSPTAVILAQALMARLRCTKLSGPQ